MAINFRSLASAWIGGAGLGTGGAGGYLIYDSKNPIGSQRLLERGYIFNPPKFTSHKSEDNSCFENLFKDDPGFDPNRTYGCRVAELNIWNSGEQFKDKQAVVDYLTFTKKLTVRKGNQGLQSVRVINTREGLVMHAKLIYYEWDDRGWTEKRTELGTKQLIKNGSPVANKQRTIKEIIEENKHLNFEANGKPWYKGKNYFGLNETSLSDQPNKREELYEVWKDYKAGSWIFVEDNEKSQDSIPIWDGLSFDFRDKPEIKWIGDDKYGYFPESKSTDRNPMLISSWYHATFNSMQSWGKWIDTEKFCNRGYERDISEDDFENLRMYCSKPKSKD